MKIDGRKMEGFELRSKDEKVKKGRKVKALSSKVYEVKSIHFESNLGASINDVHW